MHLDTSVAALNRVGKTLGKKLSHLGIRTVRDLLWYFPFRYEDFSQTVAIRELSQKEGELVTVRGKIELIANKRSPRKRTIITEALVSDDSGQLRVVWFGQPFLTQSLRAGNSVYFSGKVGSDMIGMVMKSPAYEKVHQSTPTDRTDTTHTARIVPMYSLTAGMTQKQLRFLVSQVIALSENIPEWLPETIVEEADLVPIQNAIRAIHFPEDSTDLLHAEKRLKFDEIFVLQLRAEMIRQTIKREVAPSLIFHQKEIKNFVDGLPFQLTKAQKIAAWEILQDVEKTTPMNRLLEGDVGSGKTIVAALSLYNTILNGQQAILMAPTEILAKQHFESLRGLFCALDISLGLLTGGSVEEKEGQSQHIISGQDESLKTKKQPTSLASRKRNVIEHIRSGGAHIIVGTHALLNGDVQFKNLGLVIIDEQHRFGVEQRKIIRDKSGHTTTTPHFLSMTATPIPRTFALTLYGDLDLSIINEMPAGRKPIKTRLVDPHNRGKAYAFIREQVKNGRQVFVICPLIEEKESHSKTQDINYQLEKKSVLSEYKKLSETIFPDLKVAYLHGKMKTKEKDDVMALFQKGETNVLVSTSVVEVGVDIPNASVMMIEGAERFGLAQLHQFRGRVGRSNHQSYCFLFTDNDTETVRERLAFFEKTTDGFLLAEYDLQTRGPGDVYGTAQSGMMQFRLATMKDGSIIQLARKLARDIDFAQFPQLKERVKEWEEKVHLE